MFVSSNQLIWYHVSVSYHDILILLLLFPEILNYTSLKVFYTLQFFSFHIYISYIYTFSHIYIQYNGKHILSSLKFLYTYINRNVFLCVPLIWSSVSSIDGCLPQPSLYVSFPVPSLTVKDSCRKTCQNKKSAYTYKMEKFFVH